MRFAFAVAPAIFCCAAQMAAADSYDTITFSFAEVSFHPPGTVPGSVDTIGAITDSFTVPASPTVLPPPVFAPTPGEFWIDPGWSGMPGSYPPPGSKYYIFGEDLVGFVFADNVQYPRAYSYFQTQGTLFTGTTSAPTFVPGVYQAQYEVPVFGYGYDPGTITVSAVGGPMSATPEPDSLWLLLTGAAVLGGGWVYRRSPHAAALMR